MKARILFCYCLLSLLACGGGTNPTNQLPEETATNNWSHDLEQMKQDTLDQACDDEMRSTHKRLIENQSRHLNPEEMINYMQKMQAKTRCRE